MKKKAKKKRAKKERVPPSSYETMPYYFPTEQVDIVKKLKSERRRKRKSLNSPLRKSMLTTMAI